MGRQSVGLQFRKHHAALFLKGDYVNLQVEGADRECVLAFARRYRGDWSLVIVPRFTTRFTTDAASVPDDLKLDCRVVLPKEAPKNWINIFSDERFQPSEVNQNTLDLGRFFHNFPVGFLSNSHDRQPGEK